MIDLLRKTEKKFVQHIPKGLSKAEKDDLFQAVAFAWRPGHSWEFEGPSMLLSAWLPHCRSLVQLEEIKLLVEKKKQNPASLSHIDQARVNHLQVNLCIDKLAGRAANVHQPDIDAETCIARSQILKWSGKPEKACKLLLHAIPVLKKDHFEQFGEFVSYAVKLARESGNTGAELEFLKERIKTSMYLDVKDVERLMSLLPVAEKKEVCNSLIADLKDSKTPYSTEKLALLLLHFNRVDELIQLLNRQKSKFILLHELALKLWPVVPENFLRLYASNLSAALSETTDLARQERLLVTAKKYLDQLPSQYRISVTDHVRKTALLGPMSFIFF